MRRDPHALSARLACSVAGLDETLAEALEQAEAVMTDAGLDAWLDGAERVCRLNRGTDLVLRFLTAGPAVARHCGEGLLAEAADLAERLAGAAGGAAVRAFLQALPAAAERTGGTALRGWFDLIVRVAEGGKPGLVPFLEASPQLLAVVDVAGMGNWVAFGLRAYRGQPHRMPAFFAVQTADAHAALQRERQGTLLLDNHRRLMLYLRAFWGREVALHPFSVAFDRLRRPTPYIDRRGLHLPDVQHEAGSVSGIDRYRAMIAHMMAHLRWSEPFLADNFSVFQHLAVEAFEDARVEALAMREHPGLRRLWLALHPFPREGACPEGWSCLRHRLAMLSRALLDPDHPYRDPVILDYVARFHRRMAADPLDRRISTELGVAFLKDIHDASFRLPKIWFEDTIVPYRDDNRFIWRFLEDVKNEDEFHSDHNALPRYKRQDDADAPRPHLYDEWDQGLRSYRPEWVTLYESMPPEGDAGAIDALLARHTDVVRQIRALVDRLKPQQRRRLRGMRDGDEIDLDAAILARIDQMAGVTPPLRVYQRHERAGRDLAVMLLLDLSQSLNDPLPEGGTVLDLSREAVALLAAAVEALGDPFAVAGFHSNTRHDVRFRRIKDFHEPWEGAPKARLAGARAELSTRLGAAVRHAAHHLAQRREERKLLLILSDGAPSDIDVADPEHLKWDTHAAACEARALGVHPFCVTLDPKADEYVRDVFGPAGYAVVDRVERLPERLSRLFLTLTG